MNESGVKSATGSYGGFFLNTGVAESALLVAKNNV